MSEVHLPASALDAAFTAVLFNIDFSNTSRITHAFQVLGARTLDLATSLEYTALVPDLQIPCVNDPRGTQNLNITHWRGLQFAYTYLLQRRYDIPTYLDPTCYTKHDFRAFQNNRMATPSPYVLSPFLDGPLIPIPVFAPSVGRNKEILLQTLQPKLQILRTRLSLDDNIPSGLIEIASGSGEHAAALAMNTKLLHILPIEPDSTIIESIKAWSEEDGADIEISSQGSSVLPALNIAIEAVNKI